MDRKTSPKPTLCRGGCGFYGSAATEGLCSECYKKHVEQQQEAVAKSLQAKSTKEPILHKAADNTGSKLKINQKNDTNADDAAVNAVTAANVVALHEVKCNVRSDSEESPNAGLPSTSQTVPPPTAPTTTTTTEPSTSTTPNLNETAGTPELAPKEKKNRCAECGKKVGLTGFTCRCGGLFCPIHRYSDKHNCTFNYREMGAEEIRRNNPTVTAEKIRKI